MFRRIDIAAAVGALLLHAGVALAMLSVKPMPPQLPEVIDVDVFKKEPPPPKLTEPEPPAPEPEKKIVKVDKTPPPPTPVANKEPPKEPPKEVKPIFGVNMESTTEDGDGPSVPVGNTTMIDPKKSGTGPVTPLPAGKPGGDPTARVYTPVADIYVKTLPEIDGEACARMVTYPQEAEQAGVEGEIKLRVALDEKGKVHDIKVLSGLGHGLDQAAMNALRYRCKFKPAVDTSGKPVAYVIQTYTWTFELPR